MQTQNNISDLPKLSVYRYENFFNIYTDEKAEIKFYNLLRGINVFQADNSDVEEKYIIQTSDTWASIAWKKYKTIELWWLICAYNQIQNPIDFPDSGTIIKILKPEYVSMVINELKRQIK
jgi:hypothetical protein